VSVTERLSGLLLAVSVTSLLLAMTACNGGLRGQIVYVQDPRRADLEPHVLTQIKPYSTAFLLLEKDYARLNYPGPPREVKPWENRGDVSAVLPPGWTWGMRPIEGPGSECLIQAPMIQDGRFRFSGLPPGRHTLFLWWGNNPDPLVCISGPFEVFVKRGRTTQATFLVSAFDCIET